MDLANGARGREITVCENGYRIAPQRVRTVQLAARTWHAQFIGIAAEFCLPLKCFLGGSIAVLFRLW